MKPEKLSGKKFGYHINRGSVSSPKEVRNTFVGSYGFDCEQDALDDALLKIRKMQTGFPFVFYIDIYELSPNNYRLDILPKYDTKKVVIYDEYNCLQQESDIPNIYLFEISCKNLWKLDSNGHLTKITR